MAKSYNTELWNELVTEGRKNQSNKEINVLDRDDVNTVLGTLDFFDCSGAWLKQVATDLLWAKFRVFDALAMYVQTEKKFRDEMGVGLKVLIYSFRKVGYNEKKWIDDLRRTDYQIVTDWEDINLEG